MSSVQARMKQKGHTARTMASTTLRMNTGRVVGDCCFSIMFHIFRKENVHLPKNIHKSLIYQSKGQNVVSPIL